MNETEGFRAWCIVELFGHVTLAGYVTEQEIGGTKMIRLDVPESKRGPAFSKLIGSGAIYGITPVDEATVKETCEHQAMQPFASYELQRAFEKYHQGRLEEERPYIEQQVRRSLEQRHPGLDDDDFPI